LLTVQLQPAGSQNSLPIPGAFSVSAVSSRAKVHPLRRFFHELVDHFDLLQYDEPFRLRHGLTQVMLWVIALAQRIV
jgi:hypothetical protein